MINRTAPPLELAYILAMLKKEGIESEIIDGNAFKLKSENPFWNNIKAKIFVFTSAPLDRWQCPPINLTPLIMLIEMIKKNNPDANFILLGPHGTTQPEKIREQLGDVFIVKGEPEHVTVEIIKVLLNNASNQCLHKIKGVYNPSRKINTQQGPTKFNTLPCPDYSALPIKYYKYSILGKNFALLEASRGCNYKCSFCSQVMYPKKYTLKHPKKVLDELEYLKTLNINNIEFTDLEFCLDKNHVKHICKGILQRKIDLNWCINTRVDSVDKELLNLLKKSGCSLIHYGVETGSFRLLKKTRKGITLQKVKKTFIQTEKTGIKALAFFILGNKGETLRDIIKTINFSKILNPHYVSFGLNMVYPDAPDHSRLHKKTYSIYDTEINIEELKRLQYKAYFFYYLRPRYIYKSLSSISCLHDFQILWGGFKDYFVPFLFTNRI